MRAVLYLAFAALACASSPSRRDPGGGAPAPDPVVWPKPPASPRVRLVGEVTSGRPPHSASWWRVAFRLLTGTGAAGSGTDELSRPFDVALRADGSFVLADPDRPGVLDYGADGTFRAEIVCPSSPWAAPMSVALADDGTVWVADASAAAIVAWTPRGCRVLRPDGLERPTGIALTGDRIAVADPPAHAIVLLSREGAVLARWGGRGEDDGHFNFPTDVAAAPDGSLFVVDALNFRIVHLGSDGAWLGAFGSPGEDGAGLARPKGVHVDAAGLVYVTDAQRDVVLVFRPDGTLEYVLGESGAEPGQFAHPAGLSARGRRLVVADSVNRRAEVFERVGESR